MGKSPCCLWKGNILSSTSSLRKRCHLSLVPNQRQKGNKNDYIEPTASKYEPPARKGDKTHSPDMDSPHDEPNKHQEIFVNLQK